MGHVWPGVTTRPQGLLITCCCALEIGKMDVHLESFGFAQKLFLPFNLQNLWMWTYFLANSIFYHQKRFTTKIRVAQQVDVYPRGAPSFCLRLNEACGNWLCKSEASRSLRSSGRWGAGLGADHFGGHFDRVLIEINIRDLTLKDMEVHPLSHH